METKNLKLAFSLFAEMKRYQIKPNLVSAESFYAFFLHYNAPCLLNKRSMPKRKLVDARPHISENQLRARFYANEPKLF